MKRILLHSSEAGMAAQIFAIKNLVKNKSLNLDFSVFDHAKLLIKEPSSSLTKNHELLICGFEKFEKEFTSKLILKASAMKIPSLGILDTWKGIDRFFTNGKLSRTLTDYLLVPEYICKKYLEKKGFGKKILVYEDFAKKYFVDNLSKNTNFVNKSKKKAKLNEKNKIALILSEPVDTPKGTRSLIDLIEKQHNKKAEIFFDELIPKSFTKIFRFHPKEEIKKNFFTKDNLSIYEALSISDLVIGLSSTPLFYAASGGKKIISLENYLSEWIPEQSDIPTEIWRSVKERLKSDFKEENQNSINVDNLFKIHKSVSINN